MQQNIQVLFEFPNTDGTAGQVLQTDGYANLSFGTAGSYTDTDALDLFNASGSAPVYACRAWVNFNGTGTVAINESGNVTSITDNGTGIYTVNFTTAMPDANYSFGAGGNNSATNFCNISCFPTSSSACRLNIENDGGQSVDRQVVSVAIFR